MGRSLFATVTWLVCSKGITPKFGPKVTQPPVDLSVGDIRSQIAAKWLQIAQRSQWRAYRKLPSLFLMVPSLTPYDLPFPKMGFHMPPPYANGHISATSDPIHFMFGSRVGFSGTADLMSLFSIRRNSKWRPPPSWVISNGHISATAHDLLIQRASRGHLCDSTAFLFHCYNKKWCMKMKLPLPSHLCYVTTLPGKTQHCC